MKSNLIYSTLPQISLDGADCSYRIGNIIMIFMPKYSYFNLGTHFSELQQQSQALPYLESAQANYTSLLGPMHKDSINVCFYLILLCTPCNSP